MGVKKQFENSWVNKLAMYLFTWRRVGYSEVYKCKLYSLQYFVAAKTSKDSASHFCQRVLVSKIYHEVSGHLLLSCTSTMNLEANSVRTMKTNKLPHEF